MKKNRQAVVKASQHVFTQDAFSNSLARMGFAQPTLLEGTQYPMTRLTRNYNLMTALYRDHWIVRRIIDLVSKDMMKNWIDIHSELSPEDLKKVEREVRVTRIRKQLLEAIKWGRLYGGAF